MKADKSKMFSVSLAKLRPNKPAPFPLYIFLKKNNRMVPVRLEGDPLDAEKYAEFEREHHDELWVPKSHEKECAAYLEYLEKTKESNQDTITRSIDSLNEEVNEKNPKINTNNSQEVNEKNQEEEVTDRIRDILSDKSSDKKENKELIQLAQELLVELNAITGIGQEPMEKLSNKISIFSNEVLAVASQKNTLYENVSALRKIQSSTEHSVMTGGVAAIVAAALGRTEPIWISDIITAATFHDIGLINMSAGTLKKPKKEWKKEEHDEYALHVSKGVRLLTDSEDPIPKDVIRMVQEHHEKIDGSGFPNRILEGAFFEGSFYMIFANIFSQKCQGDFDGTPISPQAALKELIYEEIMPTQIKNKISDILNKKN